MGDGKASIQFLIAKHSVVRKYSMKGKESFSLRSQPSDDFSKAS